MVDDRARENAEGDELIERVAATLREPVVVRAGFDERVMSEVRAKSTSRSLPWIVRPRYLHISPLIGLAAAAAISAITVIVPRIVTRVVPPTVTTIAADAATRTTALPASNAPDAPRSVQFVFVAPNAKTVALVGSFNDWDTSATQLRRGQGGVWTAELPLTGGRYTYSFVVDGKRWLADPTAPRSVDDDFGTPSSVLTVGTLPR
jgi:hypothetical protein